MQITLTNPSRDFNPFDDDISNLDKYINDTATDFIGKPLRSWSWIDPLREGAANLIHSTFDSSNMEIERLRSLVGLDDNQFNDAINKGLVNREELYLNYIPQADRDDYLQKQIAHRNSWQQYINDFANDVAPTEHSDPEGFWENAAYEGLKLVPGALEAVAEFALFNKIPFGRAAYILKNVISGNQASQEQVFSNVRENGGSVEDAYSAATSFLGNAGDLALRGIVDTATMNALGTPINSTTSPIRQVLSNIGKGGLYSGLGSAGENALTDIRSGNDINYSESAKQGAISAGSTWLFGLMNAFLHGRDLWELQKEYNSNKNKPLLMLPMSDELDWDFLKKNPTPDAPSNPPLALPAVGTETAERLDIMNKALTKRGFTPVSPIVEEFNIIDSLDEVKNAIRYAPPTYLDEIRNMFMEMGYNQERAQNIVNSLITGIKYDVSNESNIAVHKSDLGLKPEISNNFPSIQKPAIQQVDVPPITKPDTNVGFSPIQNPEIFNGRTTTLQMQAPDIGTLPDPLLPVPTQAPNVGTLPLNDPLLAPPPSKVQLNIPLLNNQTSASPKRDAKIPVNQQEEENIPQQPINTENNTLENESPTTQIDNVNLTPFPELSQNNTEPSQTQSNQNFNVEDPNTWGDEIPEKKQALDLAKELQDIENEIRNAAKENGYIPTDFIEEDVALLQEFDQLISDVAKKNNWDWEEGQYNSSVEEDMEYWNEELGLNNEQKQEPVNLTPFPDLGNNQTQSTQTKQDFDIENPETWSDNIPEKKQAVELYQKMQDLLANIATELNKNGKIPPELEKENERLGDELWDLIDSTSEKYHWDNQENNQSPEPVNLTPFPELEPKKEKQNKQDIIPENKNPILKTNEETQIPKPKKAKLQEKTKKEEITGDSNTDNNVVTESEDKFPIISKNSKLLQTDFTVNHNGQEHNLTATPWEKNGHRRFYINAPKKSGKGKKTIGFYNANKGVFGGFKGKDESFNNSVKEEFIKNLDNFYTNETESQPEENTDNTVNSQSPGNHNTATSNSKGKLSVEEMQFKKACDDTSRYGISSMHLVRDQLNWSREKFDNMLVNLRDKGFIHLTEADPRLFTDTEKDKWFKDENGFIRGKILWIDTPTTEATPESTQEKESEQDTTKIQSPKLDEGKYPVKSTTTAEITPEITPEVTPESTQEKEPEQNAPKSRFPDLNKKKSPSMQVAKRVSDKFSATYETLTKNELIEWGNEAWGGSMAENKYNIKDLWDAMEMGINMAIQNHRFNPSSIRYYNPISSQFKNSTQKDLNNLSAFLDRMPTQTNRTEEQNELQQFSTPPTLAYIVNWLANINKNDIVLEPSAGVGGLAVFAKNAGAKLILNELSTRRADLLDEMKLGQVYRENAEHIGDILENKLSDEQKPNKVIMNPPFSSSAGRISGQRKTSNATQHVEQALQILKSGGRLVTILGEGMAYNKPAFKSWWDKINEEYNVRAIINIDGSNYKKYGTNFGNVIAVIDKTESDKTPIYTNTFSKLEDILNDKEILRIRGGYESELEPEENKIENIRKSFVQQILSMGNPEYGEKEAEYTSHIIMAAMKSFSKYTKLSIPQIADIWNLSIIGQQTFDGEKEDKHKKAIGIASVCEDGQAIIQILKNAHKSVIIHELAHVFLNEFRLLVKNLNNLSEKAKTDWQNLINFYKLNDIDFSKPKNKWTENQKSRWSNAHEHFATSFEKYFIENKVVSKELIAPLCAFRIWILEVYGKTQNIAFFAADKNFIHFDLKPQIKDFFDNLLDNTKKEQNTETQQKENNEIQKNNTPIVEKQELSSSIKIENKSEEERISERKKDYKGKKSDDDLLNVYDDYRPSKLKIKNAKHHPADLVESAAMASVSMPEITYTPHLPDSIIEKGLLSEAQLEAVVYAGQSFEKINADGNRRGFFIGDGTGVGKGREISGVILDQLSQGHGNGKAVWISMRKVLIKDALRDWSGIGRSPDDIFLQLNSKSNEKIKQNKGILFTAYSTLGRDKKRVEQLKQWLGDDFDGVIALDEVHNIKNAIEIKNKDKENNKTRREGTKAKASNQALAVMDLVDAFPKARVLYASATGASEVEHMAVFDRLGLWGQGTQFTDKRDFINQITKGGTAAMEIVARDMKAMGLFIARSLSQRAGEYGGDENVTFERMENSLNPHQIAIYNKIAEGWQKVLTNAEKVMNMLMGGKGGRGSQLGRAKMQFWAAHQRCFNQIITALQTPAVIEAAKKDLEDGNSVVIQLTNTNQANLENAIKGLNEENTIDDLDISPKETLINFLKQSFPVNSFEEYEDDNGNVRFREVVDSEGKPVINSVALKIRDSLIAEIDSIKFPESPLDMIINAFGVDNVAEITGRTKRVILKSNGSRDIQRISPKAKEADIQNFNEGRKRILIFSEFGGTGASYHAARDIKNQQKRIHYLLQPGWKADAAMQGLGRTHRSNEAHKPHYVLVTTDLPGQKRFLSTIARRLEQLGALTTGERKTTTQGIFNEKDNLESRHVKDALNKFFTRLVEGEYPELGSTKEILEQLGYSDMKENKVPDISQFLNRILSMQVEPQKKLFKRFEEEIEAQFAYATQHDLLDVGTVNVKAKKIKVTNAEVLFHDEEHNTDTTYLELELTKKNRAPIPFSNITNTTLYSSLHGFYTTNKGNVLAAFSTSTTETDSKTGQIKVRYLVSSPDPNIRFYTTALDNDKRYKKISQQEAQILWEKEFNNVPSEITETKHMISGALLPIWHKLKGNGDTSIRIQRVKTDDGQSYLGRIVYPAEFAKISNNLGIKNKQKTLSAKDFSTRMEKLGTTASLSDNLTLKSVLVNGEKRIEIRNADFFIANQLEKQGAFSELIQFKKRLFVPTGEKGLPLLEFILKNYPVNTITERNVLDETAKEINNDIPDDTSRKLYVIHPWFRASAAEAMENDPFAQKSQSKYPYDDTDIEREFQKSKGIKKESVLSQLLHGTRETLKGFSSDFPLLKGQDNLIAAHEALRKLNRERTTDAQDVLERMRAILKNLNQDDFDLFSRAMILMDLKETLTLNPQSMLPYGFTPESVERNYKNIMKQVDENNNVHDAIEKAEIIGRNLVDDLINAAEDIGWHSLKEKFKRKHYFRHVVLEYANLVHEGTSGGLKAPEGRGYLKQRKGSDKAINSDWIQAMGEVWTKMRGDKKTMQTLAFLKGKYDIIDKLKKQAFTLNEKNTIEHIKEQIKNGEIFSMTGDDDAIAQKIFKRNFNRKQAEALGNLFELAIKGNLPEGNFSDVVRAMAEAGAIEFFPDNLRKNFNRYLGWLASLDVESSSEAILENKETALINNLINKENARDNAKNYFKGIIQKKKKMKDMLGDKYISWQDLIPENYDIFDPFMYRLVFSATTVPEYVLKIAEENIDEMVKIPISQLGHVLAMGGHKQLWVIPKELAETLNNMGKTTPIGAMGTLGRELTGKWKKWVIYTPFKGRVWKYNARNFTGDFEAVLQGNPGALAYMKQSAQELIDVYFKGKIPTGTLKEFQKRGGALTTESRQELMDWEDLDEFKNLIKQDLKTSKDYISVFPKILKGYMKMAGKLTQFREQWLRYASFLSWAELIEDNGGMPPFFGMSNPKEVLVHTDIYDMAFKLANENLGAYDQVSQNTKELRKFWIPFGSWIETNFTRNVQMHKNIWTGNSYFEYWITKNAKKILNNFGFYSGGGNGGNNNIPPKNSNGDFSDDNNFEALFKSVGKSPAYFMRLLISLAMVSPLFIMAAIWNKLMSKDDEQLTPDERALPHITLGKNPITGDIIYFNRIGSGFDFLDTFGLDTFITTDLREILDGRMSFWDLAGKITFAPLNKLINGLNPFIKTPTELLTKRAVYPDALHPRFIRDAWDYLFNSVDLDWYYKVVMGKPHSPVFNIASSLAYQQNPEEGSYWYILARKKEFQEKVLGQTFNGFATTKRGEALSNAKAAARYGDKKKMLHYLKEFYKAGGDDLGLEESLKTMDPLYGLNDDEEIMFLKWLSKQDRKALLKAIKYFERMDAILSF